MDNAWYRNSTAQLNVRKLFLQLSLHDEQALPLAIGKPTLQFFADVVITPWPMITTDHAADGGIAKKTVRFRYDEYSLTPLCDVDDNECPIFRAKGQTAGEHLPKTTAYTIIEFGQDIVTF